VTRDFAKTNKSSGKAKRKTGSRSVAKKQQSNVPAWVWVFTGIVTGAFIMFLIYLAGLTPEKFESGEAQENISQQTEEIKEKAKPIFEFYDKLTNQEVVVDVEAEPEDQTPSLYILQAASFQDPDDADSLKALLILEGLDVNIEKFKNKGETWHRVLVGPFDTRSKMAAARSKLAQHEISPIVLKKELPAEE
jgi:cell division protein FtsN